MRKLRSDTRRECKDGEVSKLKGIIRKLKKDKDVMSEEIKQLRGHINIQQEYINKHVSGKTVKQVIKEVNNKRDVCVKCKSDDISVTCMPFGDMISCGNCKDISINKK